MLALREIAAGHVTREILTQPDYNASIDDDLLAEGVTEEENLDAELAASVEAAIGEAPEADITAGDATDVADEANQAS